MDSPQNPNPGAAQDPGMNAPQNPAGPQMWHGQIVYLLRQRDDQAPAQLHFNAIAAGGPGHNIETNRWPSQLSVTSGFKALLRTMATQLYSSPLPFGQIVIDPVYAGTDQQKHAVFHKVITAGYSIFYEFPSDPMNPMPSAAPVGSARGLLFFSTPNAPSQVLFKVFTTHPCPPALCRGGQPAGPGLMGNNGNANGNPNNAAAANGANGGGAVPGAPPALVPAGVLGAGIGLPGAGLGGQPNAGASNMLGTQASSAAPGAGLGAGMVPGAGMIPGAGAGARPNPVPTQPNPAMGINPGMVQGLNPNGIPGLGSSAMPGLGVGVPGLNPNNVPGLTQAGAPAGLPMNQPRAPMNAVYQMALARLGLTPVQFASATPQQKSAIMQQVQRMMMQLNQQRQQAAAAANGMAMGVGGGRPPPGMGGPGQPGFEQLQAFMRQQQQRQGGQ